MTTAVIEQMATMRLTVREWQVLQAMAAGKSNTAIGEDLYVSEDTVKTHVRRMFGKLKATNRAHAVALGYQAGLIGEATGPKPVVVKTEPPKPEPVQPTTALRLARAHQLILAAREAEAARGKHALTRSLTNLAAAVDRVAVDARVGIS